MSLNIYTDEPAKEDMFEGKSHENLASKLSELAQSDKICIIGLDGYLGSGKSTIIDIAMEKIKNGNMHIIKFDSEIYHYGATKKALIDILYDGFKKTPGVNQENLSKCKDYALGNIYNYTRKVNSKISLWTLSFICTTVVCLQAMRFFITDFSSLFTSNHLPLSKYVAVILELILVMSPVIVGLLYKQTKVKFEIDGKEVEMKPSIGDILKRNSDDTIFEKIIVNKEVGTLELKSALEGFIKCTPKDARLILIIDNLDRISPSKIKEIWSDIELITEVAGNKLKILIPYSSKHVAKALSADEKEGLEFISKRISVNFFVPPLISTGWRNGFLKFWEDAFGELNEEECYEVCELIERWLPNNYTSVTPRFIKRIINDINLTSLTSPKFPLHRVLISFYILMVRYSLLDFKTLITDYTDTDKKADDTLDLERMRVTHKQFNRLFDSEDVWKKGLICIHFQTNSEFAISELIDEPLKNSINYRDSQEFINLSSIYGFEKAWKKSLLDTPIYQLIYFVESLSSKDLTLTKKILPEIINRLNKDKPLSNDYDESLVRALVNLNKKIPLNPNEKFLSNHIDDIKKILKKPTEFIKKDSKYCMNLFEEINLLLEITKEKFTQHFPRVSGEIFFGYLLDRENEYPNINISEIKIFSEDIVRGITYDLTNGIEFNLFSPQIIQGMRINNENFEKFLDGDVLPAIDGIYQKINSHTPIDSILELRLLSLDKRWRAGNLAIRFPHQTTLLNNNTNEYYAALIAHKVLSGDSSPIPNISSLEITQDLIDLLYNYFLFAKSLNVLVAGLANNEIKHIISPAIKKIIINKKVVRLHTFSFIREMYIPLIEVAGKDKTLSFFHDWDEFAETALSDKNHETISQDFICDLTSRNDFPLFKKTIRKIVATVLSSKELILSYIKQPQTVYREMVNLLSNDSLKIDLSNNVRVFSDFYIEEDVNSLIKTNYVKDIISILEDDVLHEIVKTIADLLERKDLDPKKQIFAIRDFGTLLSYDVNISRNDNRAIAKLFSYASEYDFLAKWLDNQKYSFSKWSPEDKKTVEAFVLGNIALFPNLMNTAYFKRRASIITNKNSQSNDNVISK